MTYIQIIVGLIALIKGADFLTEGSSKIAKKFSISTRVIGLTLVALGTSLPELFISSIASTSNHSDIALSNVVGSNLCNLLLVLGCSLLMKNIHITKSNKYLDIPINLSITVLVFFLCNQGLSLARIDGFILILGFLFYIVILLRTGKEEQQSTKKEPLLESIFKIVIGVVGLKIGGDLTINGCTSLATSLGISEKIIGLTLVAIGTSLPELTTSLIASYKGDTQMALGNVLGSNIINLTLVLGVSSFLQEIPYNLNFNYDFLFLLVTTCLVGFMLFMNQKLTRREGTLLLLVYLGYILSFL